MFSKYFDLNLITLGNALTSIAYADYAFRGATGYLDVKGMFHTSLRLNKGATKTCGCTWWMA